MSCNQKKLCGGVWEFHKALCIPDALSQYSLSLWCFLPLICTFQEDLVPALLLGKSSFPASVAPLSLFSDLPWTPSQPPANPAV